MTTEALVGTLRNYADETTDIGKKAFAAAQDVKTFSQLMDTLKEAAGSGWANTWEILFGDFEEAKELWTGLSQAIGGFIDTQSDARNSVLQGWKDLGGRTELIESLKNTLKGIGTVIKPITEAFRDIFPPTTAEQLHNLTEGLLKFTEKLTLSDTASENLKSTFKGLFAILDICKQVIGAILGPVGSLLGKVTGLGGGVLGVTGSIGEWLAKLDEAIKKNDAFGKGIEKISDFVSGAVTAIKNFAESVREYLGLPTLDEAKESMKELFGTAEEKIQVPGLELLHTILEKLKERAGQVKDAIVGLKDGISDAFSKIGGNTDVSKFAALIQALSIAAKKIGGGIFDALGNGINKIVTAVSNADFSGIIDLLNGISIGGIAIAITKFTNSLTKPFDEVGGLLDNVKGILDGVRGCFEAYQTQLKAGTLLKIASAIAILAASIVAISLIDSEKLSASLGAITVLFAELMASMSVFTKISGDVKGAVKSSTVMLAMSTSILILASALKKIGDLDGGQLAKGVAGVTALMAAMVGAVKLLNMSGGSSMKGATQMVLFAASIKILASVCTDLATLDAFKDWAEERKYYSELSLKEELAGWEALQKKYREGSEERKQIDREVYRVQNELVTATYQYSMNWIEEQKSYNKLTLAEELAAYKRVQSRYAKGTELRKKLDLQVYQLEKEISDAQKQYISDVQSVQSEANQKRLDLEEEYADKVKSINAQLASDIQAENDKYENALKSREDSLYKSYGLFDAVKERDEVSGDTLMKNLEGQVKEFGEWQDILESLAGRGLDSDLIEELQDMGPDAIAQIKALNNMSDSELEKYADLWKVKHAMAREQAVGELEGLREETQQNIAKLREEADQELTEYRALWQEKMNQVTEDANAQLEQLRRSFEEKVGLIKNNTEDELQEMADTAQKVLTEAGWDETGKQIVKGLTEGVQSEKSSFVDEITQLALAGVQAAKSTLDIHSPSRVFREIGNYTGLGFVKGLQDYVDQSYAAGSEMAESAEGGLSGVLQTIADIVSGGFDMEPVIRPVLDLSAVSAGADALNNLFYSQRAVGLVGQAAVAFEAQRGGSSQTTISVDNDDVVAELRTLRGEMASMLERMEKLRVVLNTGALVGELAEPMDAALGQRSTQRGRGI